VSDSFQPPSEVPRNAVGIGRVVPRTRPGGVAVTKVEHPPLTTGEPGARLPLAERLRLNAEGLSLILDIEGQVPIRALRGLVADLREAAGELGGAAP